ncbi:MAG TPA: hypothetical protein PK402_08145, partial [Tepidisphaeraceae bacterium]|nr:hypothetical protein [Tepidisphaeraceae bacterium]
AYIDDMGTPETSDDLIVYRPEFGFLGNDSFTYIVEDFYGSSAVGTINLVVVPGPQPIPSNTSKAFEFETRQAIVLNFNGDVRDFLERSDYHIKNANTNVELSQSAGTLSFNASGTQATLVLTNQIPNGNYRLTVGSSPTTLDFFVMAGDANRNRTVNFSDLLIVAQNYGLANRTYSQGDFNYDGIVNFQDLLRVAQSYNVTLPNVPTLMGTTPFGQSSIRGVIGLGDVQDPLERREKSLLA